MAEKGTEPRRVMTWGKGETTKYVPKALIIAGWVCVFLTYILAIPFFSALAVWVALALSIVLIRDENKTGKINGWILLTLAALKILAMLVYMFAY